MVKIAILTKENVYNNSNNLFKDFWRYMATEEYIVFEIFLNFKVTTTATNKRNNKNQDFILYKKKTEE